MQKKYTIILTFILLIAGFAGYAILKPESLPTAVGDAFKPTSQITVTAATITDDYVEVKATSTRKIVWEALGFEPGFAFKIFSEIENGKEVTTSNILTQDQELFSGVISAENGTYVAEMQDFNSKNKSKVQISFKEESCTKPDGATSTYTTTLKIDTRTMTGCADKFN